MVYADGPVPDQTTLHLTMYLKSALHPLRRPAAIALLGVSTLLSLPGMAQDAPQMNLERIKLSAGMHQIDTQVAMTPEQRQIGLMFRKEMPQSEGMIFVPTMALS